jgi:spermidine/putrescine-binding protein
MNAQDRTGVTEAFTHRLLEQRMREPINRRRFLGAALRGAAGLSGVAALAACARDSGTAGGGGDRVGGTLTMVIWEGYDDQEATTPFRDRYDVTVQPTYIGNNEEIVTKLQAGGVGSIDLVTPYNGYVEVLHDAGLLEALDYDRLPNSAHYLDRFDRPEWNTFGGQTYSAPFIWGTDPMMYNARFVKEPPSSWMDVMDPKYKGKVVMVDDTLGQIMIWAKVLGFDPPVQLTMDQLNEVIDLLIRIKHTQARAFAASWGDLADIMARGDAWVSTGGWEAITNFAAAKGADVRWVHPQEGDFAWTDSWCIPKDAPNEPTAYAWIDWILGPEAQPILARNLSGGVVNEEAIDLLDEETRSIFPYDDLTTVFEKAPYYPMPPREPGEYATLDDWNTAWERLRAA